METLKCLHVLPKTRMIVARFAGFFATIHSRWRHPSFFSHFQIYWSSSSRTEMNNKYFTLSMTFFVENVHEKSQKRNENFNYTFFLFQAIFSSFSGGRKRKVSCRFFRVATNCCFIFCYTLKILFYIPNYANY